MATKCGQTLQLLTSEIRSILLRKPFVSVVSCRSVSSSRISGRNVLKDARTGADNPIESEHFIAQSPQNTFVNRNPRNPEYFGYNKPRGYSTQYKKRNFYKRYKCTTEKKYMEFVM